MAIDISKVLVKYLKPSTADLDKCYLCLSNDFYFSSIYIEGKKKLIVYQGEGWVKREQRENKKKWKESVH